jgi:methylglyoxal synthase
LERKETTFKLPKAKRIALIAHDSRKKAMIDWVKYNRRSLENHVLFATGTTGNLLKKKVGLDITCFKSGPLGGDQQIGAKIAEHEIDVVIFFWDPLKSHPHEPDIYALQRIATTYNIILACDRATADFVISSPLMEQVYEKIVIDYESERLEEMAAMI